MWFARTPVVDRPAEVYRVGHVRRAAPSGAVCLPRPVSPRYPQRIRVADCQSCDVFDGFQFLDISRVVCVEPAKGILRKGQRPILYEGLA
jgi:hypothetical protein